MRVFVTGATGFIGSHLVTRLCRQGWAVRCLVRPGSEVSPIGSLGIEIVRGDVCEPATLRGVLDDADVIFHFAGIVSVARCNRDPSLAFCTNALGTLNLFAEAGKAKRSALWIYCSSDRIYGRSGKPRVGETDTPSPVDHYGASKLSGEIVCRTFATLKSFPFVIIRAGNTFGPGQGVDLFIPKTIRQIIEHPNEVRVGNLESYRTFVYVQDLIDALFLSATVPDARNEIFNIGGTYSSVHEVLKILCILARELIGQEPRVVVDETLLRSADGESERYELDSSKAYRVLGWKPQVSLREGLTETFRQEWERLRGGVGRCRLQ